MTDEQSVLGVEFSGRLQKSGKRIMGITDGSCLATYTKVHKESYVEIPDNWSLEDAATVLLAYSTAYDAVIRCGLLSANESILVHAGSGAVGLACATIACHVGAEVFCTVSTEEKKKFLIDFCPGVAEDHVLDSRSIAFERDVMGLTNGRGVDLVINSLAGPLLQASVRCLAVGGRFLELGKVDIIQRRALSMEHFDKSISFIGFNKIDYFWESNFRGPHKGGVVDLLRTAIEHNVVKPLPRTVFDVSQASEALR